MFWEISRMAGRECVTQQSKVRELSKKSENLPILSYRNMEILTYFLSERP